MARSSSHYAEFISAAAAGTSVTAVTVFDGATPVERPVYVWDGSSWTRRPVTAWNSTAWN